MYENITYGEKGEYYKFLQAQKANSFDIVIFGASLHSSTEDKAIKVITEALRVAKKAIYFTVPIGKWPKPGFADNPHQVNNLEPSVNFFTDQGADIIFSKELPDGEMAAFKLKIDE
jgi:ubiquinone/menaquinone biosynthesis C-methylase UbiE